MMKFGFIGIGVLATAMSLAIFASLKSPQEQKTEAIKMKNEVGQDSIVVAGGCFWCVEAIYEELEGVIKVESGYTGGSVKNPTYRDVCTGATGHAEAVRIVFDPQKISKSDLLHIFFTSHDPTTLNRQGNDFGTQYRSAIFYASDEERALAESVLKEVDQEKIWNDKIVTSIEPLKEFYMAESYHQDYFNKFEQASDAEKAEMNVGYCRAVIEPKVRKFRAKYADKLKKKTVG